MSNNGFAFFMMLVVEDVLAIMQVRFFELEKMNVVE